MIFRSAPEREGEKERSTRERLVESGSRTPPPSSSSERNSDSTGRRRRKRILWAVAGAILLLLLVLALRPSAVPVETATVNRGPLEITIDAEGVTRVRDNFQVAAPVSGRLQRISLSEGDLVGPG